MPPASEFDTGPVLARRERPLPDDLTGEALITDAEQVLDLTEPAADDALRLVLPSSR